MYTSQITPFNYEDHQVRVLDIYGEPWFVLNDLCRVLGITNPRNASSRLINSMKDVRPVDTPGGKQALTVVSEAGMYEVVIRSDKPDAATFRRWITSEVLPSIRKTGSYGVARELTPDEIVHQALTISTQRVSALIATVETQQARLAVVEPKAEAFDRWLSSNVNYAVGDVAKALHCAGADMGRGRLFDYLADLGWIYRTQRGDWCPYQAQVDTARLAVKLSRVENSRTGEEFATTTVRVTPKGAAALAVKLGVLAESVADALEGEAAA